MPKKRKAKSRVPTLKIKEIEKVQAKLVENLVSLQKVHTSLAEKFDKLSIQLSNLLSLFEMTARSFTEHPAVIASEKDKEFLDKLDRMLEQNKVIAKGLTVMGERIKDKVYGTHEEEESPAAQVPMAPRMPRIEPPVPSPHMPPQNIPSQQFAPPSEEFKPSIAGRPLKRF